MRLCVQLPTDRVDRGAELLSAAAIGEMARAAEDAGFGAVFVTDHPFPPARWLAAGGHHSLDPFVALTAAAAATRRIRLLTGVLVLPYRNPFLAAKAAATLDLVSGGRVTLGVAPGYLRGEMAALGADPQARNEATDEAIAAMKRAWTGAPVTFEGRGYRAEGNVMQPRPVQQPHPPIWVGGNSRRAIRRAATLGEGWMPFPSRASVAEHLRTAALETPADLAARIALLRDEARRAGRDPAALDVCFVPFGFELGAPAQLDAARFVDAAAELSSSGVTWLSLVLPADTRRAFTDAVSRFGREVVPRIGSAA